MFERMQNEPIFHQPPAVSPKAQRTRKPSVFDDFWEERIADAKQLAAAGATDNEMADWFEISPKTLYAWRAANPNFHQACKPHKEIVDDIVEGVAFQMVKGFRYTEQQAIKVKTGEHTEAVEVVEVERVLPPDKTMVIFWLKNRRKETWRDVQDHNVSGTVEHKIIEDPRRLAIAMLATLRKGLEAPEPLTIENDAEERT